MKLISSNIIHPDQDEKTILEIVIRVKEILAHSKIKIPGYLPLEISHHYGINQFMKYGCVIISIINRAYCKKIIILFPGQENPAHMHKIKEETFQVLDGSMVLTVDGNNYSLKAGELFTVEREKLHSFSSESGCVFEEISTSHHNDDSYYEDQKISKQTSRERKTFVTEWQV